MNNEDVERIMDIVIYRVPTRTYLELATALLTYIKKDDGVSEWVEIEDAMVDVMSQDTNWINTQYLIAVADGLLNKMRNMYVASGADNEVNLCLAGLLIQNLTLTRKHIEKEIMESKAVAKEESHE